MSVYLTEQGTVAQVWNDVKTLEEFAEKYPSISLLGLSDGKAVSGQVLENGALVNPTLSDVALAASVREKRDMLLVTEVDPIVTNPLRWADLTAAEQAAWTQYRTDLLNITDQAGFPNTVTWPTKP
tara:strand:- start:386 stop:763 length:378 start_codon:yes stop_codon:yes gene_type:complete